MKTEENVTLNTDPIRKELNQAIRTRVNKDNTITFLIRKSALHRIVNREVISAINHAGYKDRKREAAILYSRKARTRKKNRRRYLKEAKKALCR